MSRKTRIVLLLCLSLLLSSCSGAHPEQPAPPPQPAPSATAEVPGSRFADDYEVLWSALKDSYPYLPLLPEAYGIDTDLIYERYAEELTAIEDEGAFSGMIQRMLAELKNFAHLSLVTPELYQSYYYIYVLCDGSIFDTRPAPFAELLQDARLSPRYQAPQSLSAYQSTATDRRPQVIVRYYADCRALVLQMPSFAQELFERDRTVVSDALSRYPEAEHIIFDITANSGGSDYYWMENIVAPFGGQFEFSYRNYFKSSEMLDAYYADADVLPVSELGDAPAWAAALGLDRYIESSLVLPEESQERPLVQTDVKRWVLTSNTVYSASEKFVCFCKATGWATVVGSRTSGDGLGSTPVLLLLPDSGLLVRFSAMAGENPDGSINALKGTAPDVPCIKGILPLDRCLELIREGEP